MKMVGSDGAGGRERSERCRDGGAWVREGKMVMVVWRGRWSCCENEEEREMGSVELQGRDREGEGEC